MVFKPGIKLTLAHFVWLCWHQPCQIWANVGKVNLKVAESLSALVARRQFEVNTKSEPDTKLSISAYVQL